MLFRSLVQFHALSDVNPLVSVLVTSRDFASLTDFPFQQLGLAALVILFLMAATSHDFWLRALSAPAWKALHMLVYVAYALLVAHVALGALQAERHPALPALLVAGLTVVLGLHVRAAGLESSGLEENRAVRAPGRTGLTVRRRRDNRLRVASTPADLPQLAAGVERDPLAVGRPEG